MSALSLLIASLISLSAPKAECLKNCKTSDEGRQFVTELEGYSPFIYKDSAGLPTIGIGHLIIKGERFNEPFLPDEADKLLRKDLRFAEYAVNRYVQIPLKQNRADAIISFTYNVGGGTLLKSSVLKRINAGKHSEVPARLMLYVKADGEVISGLVNRRMAEGTLYIGN